MTPEIITPQTEQFQTETKQFQCRHIFTDGRRCGSPAIRGPEGGSSENQLFCYYHHSSRRPIQDAPTRKRRQSRFALPNPEDRSAIQQSIGEVLRRIASNEIDPRRAGLLLYGLQIASLNLPKTNHANKSNRREEASEFVSEVIDDPQHGLIAPPAELHANEPKGSVQRLLEELDALEGEDLKRQTLVDRSPATIDLEASADASTSTEVYVESTTSAQTVPLTQPSKTHRPKNSSDQKERSHELRSHRHCNSVPPRRTRAVWSTPSQQDSPTAPDLCRRRPGCS